MIFTVTIRTVTVFVGWHVLPHGTAWLAFFDARTGRKTQETMAEQHESTPQETQEIVADAPHGDGVDWKEQARKWEERSKNNLAQVKALKQQLGDSESLSERLEQALKRVDELETQAQQAQHSALLADVAQAKGVDVGLLHGESRAEVEKVADALLAWRDAHVASSTPFAGIQPQQPAPSDTARFMQTLFEKGQR